MRKPSSSLLSALFAVAVFMGAGPGLRLINPDAADPAATFTTLGLPTVYVWGLFWYAVQLAVIVLAYRHHWRREDG